MYKSPIIKFLFVTITVSLIACNNKKSINLNDPMISMQILVGKWSVNESDIVEEWDRKNSDYLRCIAYKLDKDSIYLGESAITKINNKIYLVSSINSKLGSKIRYYPLIESTGKSMIFKNDSTSYPNSFNYSFIDSNSFSLSVVGTIDSSNTKKYIKNDFMMNRIIY